MSPVWRQYRNFCGASETQIVRIALQQYSAESIVESIIIRVMMNMPHNLWLNFEHCARHAKYSCLGGCCAVSQDRIKHCGRHCIDCAYTTMREYHVNSFSQIYLPMHEWGFTADYGLEMIVMTKFFRLKSETSSSVNICCRR